MHCAKKCGLFLLVVFFAAATGAAVGLSYAGEWLSAGDQPRQQLRIAGRAIAAGLVGRVAVSHAFALGEVDDAEFGRTAEALAKGGVAIMTNGPGPVPMPPVKRLVAAGVVVKGSTPEAFGQFMANEFKRWNEVREAAGIPQQ